MSKELSITRDEFVVLLDCAQAVHTSNPGNQTLAKLLAFAEKPEDYAVARPLAKGGHSEVFVVEEKTTGKVYALKKIQKAHILSDPLVNPIMRERDAMVLGKSAQWLLGLHSAFQDSTSLYFLTDFVSGGDLGGVCCRRGPLGDAAIRFYAGEVVMALRELHALGIVHRDIKPENILIDAAGHIKLADFGSCARIDSAEKGVVVGTPDYVSPESLNMECGTSEKIDLWALGVVMYELKFLETPFFENSVRDTYKRILNLEYAIGECSDGLRDVLKGLLCGEKSRLRIEDLTRHPFFAGFDFSDRSANEPPFVPDVNYDGDTSNFELDPFTPLRGEIGGNSSKRFVDSFVGFSHAPNLQVTIQGGDAPAPAGAPVDDTPAAGLGSDAADVEAGADRKVISFGTSSGQDSEYIVASNRGEADKEKEELAAKVASELEAMAHELKALLERTPDPEHISRVAALLVVGPELKKELQAAAGGKRQGIEFGPSIEGRAGPARDGRAELEYQARRQMKLMQGELREAQARLEREMEARLRAQGQAEALACDNKDLLEKIRRLRLGLTTRKFMVKMYRREKWETATLYLSEDSLRIKDYQLPMDRIYFQDLKKNEILHLNSKGESLSFKLLVPSESDAATNESTSTQSAEAGAAGLSVPNERELRLAIEKETRILEGINSLIAVSKGEIRDNAIKQKTGSERKLEELAHLLAHRGGDASTSAPEGIEVLRYNNHTFKVTTFSAGQVWCYVCNRLLYGLCRQGIICRGCKMVCHRECHTLVEYSCELYSSLERGLTVVLMCKSLEDKSRIKELVGNL